VCVRISHSDSLSRPPIILDIAYRRKDNPRRGTLPTQMGHMTDLMELRIGAFRFSCIVEVYFFETLPLPTTRICISLFEYNFAFLAPRFIVRIVIITESTPIFVLQALQLTGKLPTEMGYLTSLAYLYLGESCLYPFCLRGGEEAEPAVCFAHIWPCLPF
jgi:hypothetical protein